MTLTDDFVELVNSIWRQILSCIGAEIYTTESGTTVPIQITLAQIVS